MPGTSFQPTKEQVEQLAQMPSNGCDRELIDEGYAVMIHTKAHRTELGDSVVDATATQPPTDAEVADFMQKAHALDHRAEQSGGRE